VTSAKAIEKTPETLRKNLAYNYITHILIGNDASSDSLPALRPANQKCLSQRVIAIHSLPIEERSDQRVKFCYVRIFRTCANRSSLFANRTLQKRRIYDGQQNFDSTIRKANSISERFSTAISSPNSAKQRCAS
jgi:hypothetical protein